MIWDMDDRRPPYDLKAPGGRDPDGAPIRLPGRTPFPHVDDHLVKPEVTRDEMIGGRLVVAMPAKEPHADQHSDLDYVLRAHAARLRQEHRTMITDEELKVQGVRALIAALGDVQAERFVSLLSRAPFDYTKWQATLWPDARVEDLSRQAMRARLASDAAG
jgi:hypothetical protein